MRDDLMQVLIDVLGVNTISEADSVETVKAWDSVRHLTLVLALEERFGVTFEAEEIPELISVRAIAEALERHISSAA